MIWLWASRGELRRLGWRVADLEFRLAAVEVQVTKLMNDRIRGSRTVAAPPTAIGIGTGRRAGVN